MSMSQNRFSHNFWLKPRYLEKISLDTRRHYNTSLHGFISHATVVFFTEATGTWKILGWVLRKIHKQERITSGLEK